MKLLLGSLLLAGVCSLGGTVIVPIMGNFNSQRIAKHWYPLLYISIGPVRSKTTTFYPFRFKAERNGNLKYIIRIPQKSACKTEVVVLTPQGQPGDYASNVPSTLRFVETDYNSYFVAYITRWSTEKFLAFAGNQPTVTPALKTKFREVATSVGITGEILHSILRETC